MAEEFGSSEAGKKGGRARANSMSAEERSIQAKHAAAARWNSDIPKAHLEGEFQIGATTIRAAVLPNGKRLLTQGTVLRAIGRSRSPKAGTGVLSTVDGMPFFLQSEALKPFIDEDLAASTTPIFFIDKDGRRQVGYDADLLPRVADAYLKMRDDCNLRGSPIPAQSRHVVVACDIIMRALAHVGIAGLVDEATGFQEERAKNALATILEAFVAKELRKWVKTFPLEFYKELCRLKGVAFSADMKLPQYFGHLTNDIIYSRLAPGVLQKLQEQNPVANGRRKAKHHQHLTENVGNPKLLQHLGSVVTLMKISKTWEDFKALLDDVHEVYREYPLFEQPPASTSGRIEYNK